MVNLKSMPHLHDKNSFADFGQQKEKSKKISLNLRDFFLIKSALMKF